MTLGEYQHKYQKGIIIMGTMILKCQCDVVLWFYIFFLCRSVRVDLQSKWHFLAHTWGNSWNTRHPLENITMAVMKPVIWKPRVFKDMRDLCKTIKIEQSCRIIAFLSSLFFFLMVTGIKSVLHSRSLLRLQLHLLFCLVFLSSQS